MADAMPPIPLFVAGATSSPGRGKSFSKREAFWHTGKLSLIARGSLSETDSPGRGRWHEVPEGEQLSSECETEGVPGSSYSINKRGFLQKKGVLRNAHSDL